MADSISIKDWDSSLQDASAILHDYPWHFTAELFSGLSVCYFSHTYSISTFKGPCLQVLVSDISFAYIMVKWCRCGVANITIKLLWNVVSGVGVWKFTWNKGDIAACRLSRNDLANFKMEQFEEENNSPAVGSIFVPPDNKMHIVWDVVVGFVTLNRAAKYCWGGEGRSYWVAGWRFVDLNPWPPTMGACFPQHTLGSCSRSGYWFFISSHDLNQWPPTMGACFPNTLSDPVLNQGIDSIS